MMGWLMRKYETVVVFDPDFSESRLKDEIHRVQTLIDNSQGQEVQVSNWGKKEIAYLAGKGRFGHYVAFNFSSGHADIIKDLAFNLRIMEGVLKFQSHRINERVRKFKGNPKYLTERAAALEDGADVVEAEY